MNLLHVIPSFAPAWRYGGPIYAALGLTRELARQGHQVSVATTNIDGPTTLDVPTDRPVAMDGVSVRYYPVESPRKWCFSRAMTHGLKSQVKEADIVHIHSIFQWPTTIASYWCRKLVVPYIVRPAGMLDPIAVSKPYEARWASLKSRVQKGIYLHTWGRRELNRAAALHFTSQAERENVAVELRLPGFVVPLGIDVDALEKASAIASIDERYPYLKDQQVVLFLSRLDPKKGLELLIEAFDMLDRSDAVLAIAGDGEPSYTRKLRAKVQERGLAERVIFLGRIDGEAKWALLRGADVFVLPSYQENFGLAVVEAMAAGVPVVISKHVNIWKEVSDAEAGLITEHSPHEIAVDIERILADESLRDKLGQNGEDMVRACFTWEKVVDELVRVYQQVVHDGRPIRHGHTKIAGSS